MIRRTLTVAIALSAVITGVFFAGVVLADHHLAGEEKAPPKVGEVAKDFTLKNVDGKDVKLSAITEKGNVALLFMRGYPGYQCPICSRQFADLLGNAEKIKEAGGSVVLIYPGGVEDLDKLAKEFIKGRRMPEHFYFLIDPEYSAVNAYSLRWDAQNETAYPSTFILDKERKVSFAKVSKSHGGRTTAAEVIAELKKVD